MRLIPSSLLAFSILAPTATAQQVAIEGDELVFQFDEVEGTPLDDLIKVAQTLTGHQLTFEPRHTNDVRLRFLGEKRIDKDQFWAYFQALLRSKEFVIVPFGKVSVTEQTGSSKPGYFAIRPTSGGVAGGGKIGYIKSQAPIVSLEQLQALHDHAGLVLTCAFPLKHVNVQEAVNMLSTYFTDPTLESVRAVNNSNSFVATGFATTLAGIHDLIAMIDRPPAEREDPRTSSRVALKHAVAEEIEPIIRSFLGTTNANQPSPQPWNSLPMAGPPPVVESDARTNALVVLATAMQTERIRGYVETLDVPVTAAARSEIVALEHSVAKEVVDILQRWSTDRLARFVAVERNNSILISGPERVVAEATAIVDALDVPVGEGE